MQARSVASNRLLAEIAGEARGERRKGGYRRSARSMGARKAHGAVTPLAKLCAPKERKRTRGEERGKWNV
jgi:hypothetical protein